MDGKSGSNANCASNAERKKIARVSQAKPSQVEGGKNLKHTKQTQVQYKSL